MVDKKTGFYTFLSDISAGVFGKKASIKNPKNKNQQNFFQKNIKKVDTNKNVFYILQNVKYILAFQEGLVVYVLAKIDELGLV